MMTNTGLATPPRAARPRLPRPVPPQQVPRRPPEKPRHSFDRVLAWSLAVSALLHLLFLLLGPPLRVAFHSAPGDPAPATVGDAAPFGLEMIVAIPTENAPDLPPVQVRPTTPPVTRAQPTVPSQIRPTQPGQAAQPGPVVPSPGPAAPGGQGATPGDGGLRPGFQDPRLYAPVDEFPEVRKTEHERYMEHLQARIDAVNDSMGVESNRASRTSDWTVTDRDGNRWGLSKDGLHLGGITIPDEVLPRPAPSGDNQTLEADRERLRQREEIQRQAADAERAETSRERIEAIRAREAAERQGAGNQSP